MKDWAAVRFLAPLFLAPPGATSLKGNLMAYTHEEMRKKTVAQLREIAAGTDHEALHGYSTMHKHQLVRAICQAKGIDIVEHHSVVGIDKTEIKSRIRELKQVRDRALTERDHAGLRAVRRRIHRLKRRIHKATR
jgi:hypothetical protein